jgi:hypothetical protein
MKEPVFMTTRENAMWIASTIILFLAVAILGGYLVNHNREFRRYKNDSDYLATTFFRKTGATALWKPSKGMVSYDLRSFDGGKHWYAIDPKEDGVVILGLAEEVYPGLLAHLANMDALTSRVESKGPLNLNNPNDVQLLQKIGFTVTNR